MQYQARAQPLQQYKLRTAMCLALCSRKQVRWGTDRCGVEGLAHLLVLSFTFTCEAQCSEVLPHLSEGGRAENLQPEYEAHLADICTCQKLCWAS